MRDRTTVWSPHSFDMWVRGRGVTPDLDQTRSKTTNRRSTMRAMRAEEFSGYEALKLVDLPKPAVGDGRALLRITATGVTPLYHTLLSGQYPPSKAPLVLGHEVAGVVEP